ncbi:hypothetical protein [Streptomyces sp. NPDC048057]|uniref:hypothetical protein n=1 Tax=Streptomyces sp. NPDC048057 TaxID=3155628 RepID=UPI0033DA7A9A
MSAFVQQLPALIGVVVGAIGSYLAITRGDRARFQREQEVRWEERRLALYADYARDLKRSVTLAYRLAAHFGCDSHPHPLAPADAEPLFAEAANARDASGEALLMLGAQEVVASAREWVTVVMDMEAFLRGATHDPERWAALPPAQRAARARYYESVRRDLALPAGHSGQWPVRENRSDRAGS